MNEQGRTLYSGMPSWLSRALLVLMFALVVLPALSHSALHIQGERRWGEAGPAKSDMGLYQQVVTDMEKGRSYYQAAAAEHRNFHYPTSPAPVFRMPTLAWILVILHFHFVRLLALGVVYGASIVLLYRELLAAKKSFPFRIGVLAVAITGLSVAGATNAIYWHEVWAALLIAVSLLSYRADRWWPSVLSGLLACLIREIAAPYLLVMAIFAFREKRRAEFAAWGGAALLFAAAFAIHLRIADTLYRPGDIISASWLGFGGWNFAIASAKWNILLHPLPYPIIALAICLGVIGLSGARDRRAHRAAVLVVGYLAGLMVVGRPDNYYWGILYAPLLPMGWVLLPAAASDLLRSAFPAAKS
jgi:hypothetical protein